jgi:menaquinone-dependent protoporphyrinogen oxidase
MKHVLIAYVSHGGQTEKIARSMSDALVQAGHRTELLDLQRAGREIDWSQFDASVLAAPIYAAGYPRPAIRFARRHRQQLNRIPSVFVSVGLAVASRTHDGRAQTRAVVDRFVARTGLRPARVELVAGSLLYSRYNFLKRYVMQRIARVEGGDTDTSRDYEYTDWAALARFMAELGRDLERETLTGPKAEPSPGQHPMLS